MPIPAATVVVFRDAPDGPPELLIVERAPQLAFAAGALVFPGGRIDPGDRVMAQSLPGDPDDMAARVAAIREAIEEAGLPVGLKPVPDAATLDRVRAALHAGEDFAAALATAGVQLDPDALIPFARWCPNHPDMRIFDTRFYLARLPVGAPAARVDATEHTRLFWASATAVLAMCARGEAAIIFPTRRNLERLAPFASFAEAVADTARWPIVTITPWIAGEGDHRRHIPDAIGYPVTSEPLGATRRS